MVTTKMDLNKWIPGQSSPDERTNVRDDCYLSILPSFQRRFPDALYEYLMGANPYGLPSPLAPPDMLLHAALSRTGQYAPGYTIERFNQSLLKYFYEHPKALNRIKELAAMAKSQLVILVGKKENPLICGRRLTKQLILECMNRETF